MGGSHQSIDGPMHGGISIGHCQRSARLANDRPRGKAFGERNDLASFVFGQSRLPPLAGPITQTVNSLGFETHETVADRLRMTAQFVRNLRRAQPVPASD